MVLPPPLIFLLENSLQKAKVGMEYKACNCVKDTIRIYFRTTQRVIPFMHTVFEFSVRE